MLGFYNEMFALTVSYRNINMTLLENRWQDGEKFLNVSFALVCQVLKILNLVIDENVYR